MIIVQGQLSRISPEFFKNFILFRYKKIEKIVKRKERKEGKNIMPQLVNTKKFDFHYRQLSRACTYVKYIVCVLGPDRLS